LTSGVRKYALFIWTTLSGASKIFWAIWFWKILKYFKISNKFNVPISLYPIVWMGMMIPLGHYCFDIIPKRKYLMNNVERTIKQMFKKLINPETPYSA
jgi:hypothetical protein